MVGITLGQSTRNLNSERIIDCFICIQIIRFLYIVNVNRDPPNLARLLRATQHGCNFGNDIGVGNHSRRLNHLYLAAALPRLGRYLGAMTRTGIRYLLGTGGIGIRFSKAGHSVSVFRYFPKTGRSISVFWYF